MLLLIDAKLSDILQTQSHTVRSHTPHIIAQPKQLNTTSRPRMALSTAPTVQWPAKKVRDTFLDFFKNKGHSFGMYHARFLRPAIADIVFGSFLLGNPIQ